MDVLTVDFAGELSEVTSDSTLSIGRRADLTLDDDPGLDDQAFEVVYEDRLWWLKATGARLTAAVSAPGGVLLGTVRPGGRIPLIVSPTTVTFSVGSTTYELFLDVPKAPYGVQLRPQAQTPPRVDTLRFTASQRLAILALAEPLLASGSLSVPTAVDAADRLGWSRARFNRKIDNICDKLSRAGIDGLRGSANGAALQRRSRLATYAVRAGLVTAADLSLLDQEKATGVDGG